MNSHSSPPAVTCHPLHTPQLPRRTIEQDREFIKKKGLEGMLDAKAIRKRWENLVQKYKDNEKQADEVIQEMQREQREREEKREREAAEREERRHQEAVEREERRHRQTVEREERFFREMREREDRRDREMAAREREASAREERLLAILDVISKKI
ncbi:protein enabled homolog [Fundulus heteroclitus]|uniref:protein enabled homolog n=1 Tax=Fundulus heteroclitus TaxID=8078 RepID=UPI00165C40A6|nr:protein enabled homolog [Fundulus heteroclitus]